MSARIVSGIYRIRNTVNGKVYVGSAVNLAKRWRVHKRDLIKAAHHCSKLQRAWIKYGETAFVFEVIEAVERNKAALDSREQAHLDDAFAAGLAYNLAPTAGSCLGRKHSAETLARMSAAQKGRIFSEASRARMSAAHQGILPTAETRTKLSIAAKAKGVSPKTRAAGVAANTGRKHPPEFGAKVSARNLARGPVSPETLKRMAAGQTGRRHSAESRAKRVLALKGRAKSEAHRASMVAAWKTRAPASAKTREKMRANMLGNTRARKR